jgi:3-hydroxyisobutyrate dehydrogenase-like beta-hydroxyacid dehydrogenase
MLADDRAVRETILDGDQAAIRSLRREAVHMSSSTVSIDMSKELEQRHRERSQGYIAAPIIGRPDAAAERKLWIVAAGQPSHVERCRPVMEAASRGISVVAEEPWRANLVKIAVNFVLASMLETLGESYALVEKHGIDARKFLEVLNGGAFQSPVIENYGNRIVERRYDPAGFALHLGHKDAELALDAATSARSPMPLAGVLRDHFLQALAYGHGELDWSALAEVSRINANVVRTVKAGG